jgi:hypothetical protein
VTDIDWPEHWQAEARERVTRYFGGDERPRIVVGDPATSIDGTVIEGYVYLDGKVPTIIHDRSGRSDVYPERLLLGPVLRIYELRPRRKPSLVFSHPGWTPPRGE